LLDFLFYFAKMSLVETLLYNNGEPLGRRQSGWIANVVCTREKGFASQITDLDMQLKLVKQNIQEKEQEALGAAAKAEARLAAVKENHNSKVVALHKLNPLKYNVGKVTALYTSNLEILNSKKALLEEKVLDFTLTYNRNANLPKRRSVSKKKQHA
jgi:hypothetical protein